MVILGSKLRIQRYKRYNIMHKFDVDSKVRFICKCGQYLNDPIHKKCEMNCGYTGVREFICNNKLGEL